MTSTYASDEIVARLPRRERPHLARKLTGIAVAAVVLFVLQGLVTNSAFQWSVVREYFFSNLVLRGVLVTIGLTVASMVLTIVVAIVIAAMRLSENGLLRSISWWYVWFFRSVPLLVLLILFYNFALIYPRLSAGIPFGPEFFDFSTADIIPGYMSAILAFGLQQASYTSETIRATILAVPPGQREAASSIGLSRFQSFRLIILPQAFRIAVPPLGNDTINMLKGTSLVAFIAVPDLLYSAQSIYGRTFQIIPLLMVACLWYMILVSVLSVGQAWLEKRMREGRRATQIPTTVARDTADTSMSKS